MTEKQTKLTPENNFPKIKKRYKKKKSSYHYHGHSK